MRKILIIFLCFSLLSFSGCREKENTDTRILMNTVVTIKAHCSQKIISEAFALCTELENKLSRTVTGSDISKINNSNDFVEVSEETVYLIEKAVGYSYITEGKFDITVCPVSSLYDFASEKLPKKEDISKALLKVDYRNIAFKGNKICLKDGSIDFGGIAKGYIADKVVEFLKERGVTQGTVNIGGNVYCFGKRNVEIGIKKPFSNELIATVKGGEGTYVTSGIYERYIEVDGRIYHHIIDPETGYGVENELASVTVIGKSSADADAISTSCMLLGEEVGLNLIEITPDTEAVFVRRNGTLVLSSGLKAEDEFIVYK